MNLPEFVLARIAEDEEVARAATRAAADLDRWRAGGHRYDEDFNASVFIDAPIAAVTDYETASHIARHDPARVLAECEAKRRMVELHALARTMGHQCVAIDGPTQHHMADPCATLRLLALPYADHPDWREEWRP